MEMLARMQESCQRLACAPGKIIMSTYHQYLSKNARLLLKAFQAFLDHYLLLLSIAARERV